MHFFTNHNRLIKANIVSDKLLVIKCDVAGHTFYEFKEIINSTELQAKKQKQERERRKEGEKRKRKEKLKEAFFFLFISNI